MFCHKARFITAGKNYTDVFPVAESPSQPTPSLALSRRFVLLINYKTRFENASFELTQLQPAVSTVESSLSFMP